MGCTDHLSTGHLDRRSDVHRCHWRPFAPRTPVESSSERMSLIPTWEKCQETEEPMLLITDLAVLACLNQDHLGLEVPAIENISEM